MFDLKDLAKFLIKAKTNTYASINSKELKPQRLGFKELEYKSGKYYYRDSYTGFFSAPGQEIVYYENKPIWAMAYSGGMTKKYHKDINFAKETFGFLKQALSKVKESKPYRGPEKFKSKDWLYLNNVKGNINDFIGTEKIYYKNKLVFKQNYIGGIVIGKN